MGKFLFQCVELAGGKLVLGRTEKQQRHRSLPRKVERFGEDHRHFAGPIDQPALDDVCRQGTQHREGERDFRKCVGLREIEDLFLNQRAAPV